MTEHRYCRIYPWRTLKQCRDDLRRQGWRLVGRDGDTLVFERRAG